MERITMEETSPIYDRVHMCPTCNEPKSGEILKIEKGERYIVIRYGEGCFLKIKRNTKGSWSAVNRRCKKKH